MTVKFVKNIYNDRPNRWYACPNYVPMSPILFFDDELDYVIKKLSENDFTAIKERRSYGEKAHETYFCLYLEFEDPADEARFIMWLSNNNIDNDV